MTKADPRIQKNFVEDMEEVLDADEKTLLEAVNRTVLAVEKSTEYSTSRKLKIYANLSSLCNCEVKERHKWATKAARSLK